MTLGEVIRRGLSAFCCRLRDRLWLLRLPALGFGTLEDGTAVVKNAEVVMCRSLKRLSSKGPVSRDPRFDSCRPESGG